MCDAVAPVAPAAGEAVAPVAGAVDQAAATTTGGVDSLLSGGSLLDANIDINADANATAPINGAVAANANVGVAAADFFPRLQLRK